MKTISDTISAALAKLYGSESTEIELSLPEPQFGDVATNVAMRLAKSLGKSPREIAEQIAEQLRLADGIKDARVEGPGFINIVISDELLWQAMSQPPEASLKSKKVLVEYSDPNPFKPLHAGHLYTTLVGDSIARLIENAGADIVRLNYGGDVGLHVAKCMWAIVKHLGGEHPDKLDEVASDQRHIWMGERYVEGNNAYENDETAKQGIIAYNKAVYKIHETQDKESNFANIYWTCRQWSYDYFPTLYEQLQIVPFDRYIAESEVTPLGIKTVTEQIQNGIYEHSDGAVVFKGEKYGLHTRVFINSEGLPTYEAKDVGLSLTKWQEYQFDESIIITASEQLQYMQVVLKSIEQFKPEPAKRTTHLTHGVVKLGGGQKMSSRTGNVVMAADIIESALNAGKLSGKQMSEDTILAAIKYAFAKNRIGGDVLYDPAESIALEGNSGPYLQYAHARARGILRKSDVQPLAGTDLAGEERELVRKLTEYSDVVKRATSDLAPHHICTYLYELSQVFNRFYEKSRVIGDLREAQRLKLVENYADVLKSGLGLLGISAPDRL